MSARDAAHPSPQSTPDLGSHAPRKIIIRRVSELGRRLADEFGATAVSFLIANYSGQRLVRLGHDGDGTASRSHGHETVDATPPLSRD